MADLWQEIASTVASEFSDVPDATQATRIVVRLAMAALLGGLLGWEREHAGKAAGVRTHMLVAMGAALFVLVAQQAGIEAADNSRVLQAIIAGVGFLGAGTNLKREAESQVKGLTTAAGIWLTAAIGVAAGLGERSTSLQQLVHWGDGAAPAGFVDGPALVFYPGSSIGNFDPGTALRLLREAGAVVAVLGGVQVLAFTGGIGEHDALLRADACHALGFLGITLDEAANRAAVGDAVCAIHASGSAVEVWVVPTDEGRVAAQAARALLG